MEFGYPDRTFFELFAGEHPSDKIYSVQVKDWKKYFLPKDADLETPEYIPTPAVVRVGDSMFVMENREQHLRVEPTAELIEFLAAHGVQIPSEIYVQPMGFAWDAQEVYSHDDFPGEDSHGTSKQKPNKEEKSSQIKAILATIVAVVTFLK